MLPLRRFLSKDLDLCYQHAFLQYDGKLLPTTISVQLLISTVYNPDFICFRQIVINILTSAFQHVQSRKLICVPFRTLSQ